ncbi:hypothetical protein EX30DRAFT_37529 [Ascodesmis nigricans]|uniref:Uncharacterized protein n=1 Tax=Ascodesmis nigricans TaxID=341454 RepID=A0A4S2MX19_9PEZI|nr:hypothetical protein EX30DRAFT_37529 [Ascodesmis nigricans]
MIPEKPLPEKYRITRPSSNPPAGSSPNVRHVWLTPTPGQSRSYHTSALRLASKSTMTRFFLHAAHFSTLTTNLRQKTYHGQEDEDPELTEEIARAAEARELARQVSLDDAEDIMNPADLEIFPEEDLEAKRALRRERRRLRKERIAEIKAYRNLLAARRKLQKIELMQSYTKTPTQEPEYDENAPPKILWGSAKMTKEMEAKLLMLKQKKKSLEGQMEYKEMMRKIEEEERSGMGDPLKPKSPVRFSEPRNLEKPLIRFHWGNYGPDENPEDTNVWKNPARFPETTERGKAFESRAEGADAQELADADLETAQEEPGRPEPELSASPEDMPLETESHKESDFDRNYDPELEEELDTELDAELSALEAEDFLDVEPEIDRSPVQERRANNSGIMWEIPRISRREIVAKPAQPMRNPASSTVSKTMKTPATESGSRPKARSGYTTWKPFDPSSRGFATRARGKGKPMQADGPGDVLKRWVPPGQREESQPGQELNKPRVEPQREPPAEKDEPVGYFKRWVPQTGPQPVRDLLKELNQPRAKPPKEFVEDSRPRIIKNYIHDPIPKDATASSGNPFAHHIRNRPEWYTIWPRHTRWAHELLQQWKGDSNPTDPRCHLLTIMLCIAKELQKRSLCVFQYDQYNGLPFQRIDPWIEPPVHKVGVFNKARKALKNGTVLQVITPVENGDLWKAILDNPPNKATFPNPLSTNPDPLPLRHPTQQEEDYAISLIESWIKEDLVPVRVTALIDEFQYRFGFMVLKHPRFFLPNAYKRTCKPTKAEILLPKAMFVTGMSASEWKAERKRILIERSMLKMDSLKDEKQKVILVRKMKKLYDGYSKRIPIARLDQMRVGFSPIKFGLGSKNN